MNKVDIANDEEVCCRICEEEQSLEGKTVTVYSARVNPIYRGLPQRYRSKKGQQIKEEVHPQRFYSQIEKVKVLIGYNCRQKRWEGLVPWAAGLGVLGFFLSSMTRPNNPAAFVLTYGFFLIILWGFLALIYDPDEYVVHQLNAQRTELERYKVYLTRRAYKRLIQKKHD